MPFICIAKDCDKPNELYKSMAQWLSHMSDAHSSGSSRIVRTRTSVFTSFDSCPICGSQNPDDQDFRNHIARHLICLAQVSLSAYTIPDSFEMEQDSEVDDISSVHQTPDNGLLASWHPSPPVEEGKVISQEEQTPLPSDSSTGSDIAGESISTMKSAIAEGIHPHMELASKEDAGNPMHPPRSPRGDQANPTPLVDEIPTTPVTAGSSSQPIRDKGKARSIEGSTMCLHPWQQSQIRPFIKSLIADGTMIEPSPVGAQQPQTVRSETVSQGSTGSRPDSRISGREGSKRLIYYFWTCVCRVRPPFL